MNSFDEAWSLICDFCKTRITDVAYKTWISRIEPVKLDFDEGKAVLMVPNEFHRQTLNRCYLPLLNKAFSDIFGSGIDICFMIPDEVESSGKKSDQNLAIDSEYEFTFDTYIVGSSNKFAHAAALAVASNPAGDVVRFIFVKSALVPYSNTFSPGVIVARPLPITIFTLPL